MARTCALGAYDPGSNPGGLIQQEMAKRVFIIHGWWGTPKEGWYPWLAKELEKKGFEVYVPEMPNTGAPKVKSWISKLEKVVGKLDGNTYFVGHSIAALTILFYLEKLPEKTKCGGAVFVAPWFRLTEEGQPYEEWRIEKAWTQRKINLDRVLQKTKKFVAIFGDDDPYVNFKENKRKFEKFCKVIVEKGKKHVSEEFGVMTLPSALRAVLDMAKV